MHQSRTTVTECLTMPCQALMRRAQLKALVGLHAQEEGGVLSSDEISIITGALDLTSKTAGSAMTPLEKVRVSRRIQHCVQGVRMPPCTNMLCAHRSILSGQDRCTSRSVR
jgi:hypothetical protein